MQTILIFSKSRTASDPRVRKQVEFLSRRYGIINLGFGVYEYPGVDHVDLAGKVPCSADKVPYGKILRAIEEKRLLATLFSKASRYAPRWMPFVHTVLKDFLAHRVGAAVVLRRILHSRKIDLIIANDFSALSTCVWAAKGRKVLYDAHEYTLGQASHNLAWMREHFPYIRYALSKYLPRCSKVMTVSDGIADEYTRVFGIPRPDIIRNAAPFVDQRPSMVSSGRIRIVHHGVAARQRSLETMIEAVLGCEDRFELDFFLVATDTAYLSELKALVGSSPRIHFREPVAMTLLSRTLNEYDIGLYILPPTNFNHIHALPNKIFEFIQARLAIAVAPSPEMANLVRTYDLGVVAEDHSVKAMITALSNLSDSQIEHFKRNSDLHAKELSAESEMNRLENIVETLLTQH